MNVHAGTQQGHMHSGMQQGNVHTRDTAGAHARRYAAGSTRVHSRDSRSSHDLQTRGARCFPARSDRWPPPQSRLPPGPPLAEGLRGRSSHRLRCVCTHRGTNPTLPALAEPQQPASPGQRPGGQPAGAATLRQPFGKAYGTKRTYRD